MLKRRYFLKLSAMFGAGVSASALLPGCAAVAAPARKPVVISTWDFGMQANEVAFRLLQQGARAVDAVQRGVMLTEADSTERSVGYGGRPDRDGKVTLDACIMDEFANIGAVAALQQIKHPVAVARAVMEHTPHVMLVGQGALDFALAQGFAAENLLTAESEQEWRQWLKDANYRPIVNIENHDTIGMLALDSHGNLGGACTTSGMAFKMHGRVGDSPIIGAGLYVDNEIGAATATGHGEEVIRVTGSFLVVELMRQGYSPQQACEQAVQRIYHKLKLRNGNIADTQIGFIALNKQGEYGSYCLQPGFNYAVQQPGGSKLYPAAALLSG